MVYTIKAVKNFQTCEFTYCDDGGEELGCCLEQAACIVEQLDSLLQAQPQTSKEVNKELASEKQIKFAVSLGLDETKAKRMSKQEVWSYIQSHKK